MVAETLGDRANVDAEHPVWRHLQLRDLVLVSYLVVEMVRKVYHPLLFARMDLVQCRLIHRSVVWSYSFTCQLLFLCHRFVFQYRERVFFLRESILPFPSV